MLPENRSALKEWAVVARALGSGRQTLLLRKGGIHERRGEFEVEHSEFFIFPTYLHQKRQDLLPDYHGELDRSLATRPPADLVSIDCYAIVKEVFHVCDLASLKLLEGEHILSWSAVEKRFFYRNHSGLHVLALRIYKLPQTFTIPNTSQYDGCASWVDLDQPLPTAGSGPVLPEIEFRHRLEVIRRVLAPAAA
jgi:hypothetical protein